MSRSAWRITWSVWHALLLREAVARMFGRRAAAVWLFLEPVAQIGFLVFVFTVLRAQHVGGMAIAEWLTAGMLSFLLFKRTGDQGAAAVAANLALFTYRQVRPIDTVMARGILEGITMVLISALIASLLFLLDIPLSLDDPLLLLVNLGCIWALGLGWGLTLSVVNRLLPDLGQLIGVLMTPLFLLSGVVVPLTVVPQPWRDWLLLNPLAHGVEGVRASLSTYYHHVPELDTNYLVVVALSLLAFGLALHLRFRHRLIAE